MKPFLPILAAFIVAAGVAGYATAESAGPGLVLDQAASEREHGIEPVPAPVSGELLFAEAELPPGFNSETCVLAVQVLDIFAREMEMVGGEVLTLSGRSQQDFADHWRLAVDMPSVAVSQVLAHVVPGEDGDTIVDVVEIDAEGCAASRTLITGMEWADLLQAARPPEV